MSLDKYQEARNKIAAARKVAQDLAKEVFTENSKALFDKYPILQSFSWEQYTPYFNDGDTCYFGVNADPGYSLNVTYAVEGEKEPQSYREYRDEKSYNDPKTPIDDMADEISKFIYSFEGEDLETMFGDHVTVTVNRDLTTSTDGVDHE